MSCALAHEANLNCRVSAHKRQPRYAVDESVRSTDGCPSGAPLAELNVSSSSEPSSQPSEEEDSSMFSASSKTRRRYGRSSTITAINLQSTVVVHMSSEAHIHAALTTRALALSQLV